MAAAASSSSTTPLKLILLSATLLSITLFFLLFPPHRSTPSTPFPSSSRRLLQSSPSSIPSHCSSILSLGAGGGLLNYTSLHFCLLSQSRTLNRADLSLPVLGLFILLHFYALVKTASDHFTPVVTALSSHLRLSPSMAAVTLLALGNGAPDLFASVSALSHGQSRTGLAAILSAGAFVSAFVVGSVAVIAAPFSVDPAPFVRDVFFYLLATLGLFYVYLSAEIFLWQAVGFICFYLFFVGLVFWMDLGGGHSKKKEEEVEVEMGLVENDKEDIGGCRKVEIGDRKGLVETQGKFFSLLKMVCCSGMIEYF